jgi:TolA-binding protein
MPTATSPAATGPGLASPSPTASARPSLEELARVDPPPYAPLVLRGAEPREGAFERAMERYARGDHAAAAAGLRKAVTEDPASSEARFYLGVSELLAGRPPQAVRELSRVAAADDPEFAEAARYYLAKAHLAQRDVEGARAELRRLAQGDGAHKERAERLLQALRAEP